ncbi:serine/threonine-protein kinase Nek2 [Lucilia cuprina]|uniref:serine/threonine-protein kinase Nek2 n=1 Tax=Lucilia cuprina TaxID=7375 RepID=UPI001F060CDB|nr:serine/threonine-protein kinase Nek2 [Lucilia cuprina]
MSKQENKMSPAKEAADTSLNFSKKTLQDYEVISVIGNGAFGTCFKVRDKENGNLYAWKGMDYDELSENQKESLVSEIRVLRQLQHPNIVQYYHHLVNYEAKSIFIVMECCEGGDLSQLIAKAKAENKRFEERYIWRVLFQVCRALQVCHNKIKEGTILHRDIKPANIFLDMEGNAKLGDFGLARMLRRNESFAETFVGTPYYMSPEIVKGSKYDRKSDVWAVGCLIYEMCSLRPPFKGKEFNQLSANISIGKFSSIPDIYSQDLQEIIAFMLEVENEQRPSIEVISRHPILVRNISELGNEFPILVDIEIQHQDFYVESDLRSKSDYSPLRDFSSTMFSEQNSFNEGYGQRRLSITGVFTPDLKAELFYSAKRKIFPFNSKLQLSDPELYESIRREEYATIDDTLKPSNFKAVNRKQEIPEVEKLYQPDLVTRNVFDDVLQERLQAIRAHESLLRQREENLNAREQLLNEKEKRLIAFEQSLVSKCQLFKEESSSMKTNSFTRPSSVNERLRMPLQEDKSNLPNLPPPIPPRKPTKHDETYCTIEPSDTTLLHQPTVAKLNMAALPAVKAFPTLRKVTFQSPKKFITYDIDNKTSKLLTATTAVNNPTHMHSSTSSKSSEDSSESTATSSSSSSSTSNTKRKSILSIFGLSRNNKETTSSTTSSSSSSAKTAPTSTNIKEQKDHQRIQTKEERVISKCETAELTNIWTKEHKKAAFEMLAAMNAAERSTDGYLSNAPRHKIRQSVRDRNTLQRTRLRRSLMAPPRLPIGNQREQIVI